MSASSFLKAVYKIDSPSGEIPCQKECPLGVISSGVPPSRGTL